MGDKEVRDVGEESHRTGNKDGDCLHLRTNVISSCFLSRFFFFSLCRKRGTGKPESEGKCFGESWTLTPAGQKQRVIIFG